jgi:hypothetical protein
MAQSKPNETNPASASTIHRELLACLICAGELSVEWKLLQRTAHTDPRLPKSARLAIALVAWRAQSKCVAVADNVIAGMLSLVRGERQRVTRKLRSCQADLEFLAAADRTVAAIIRKFITRAHHGN